MLDALLAGCLSMAVTLAAGPYVVAELRRRRLGKAADADVAASIEAYAGKAGTPTMGGVIFLLGVAVAALAFAVPQDGDTLIPLGAMLAAGALALLDDLQTLAGSGRAAGHEVRGWFLKWGVLLIMGGIVSLLLHLHLELRWVLVPHFGAYALDAAYVPIALGVFFAASSGAVITDGMDGLMAGLCALAYAAYGVIALHQGQDALGAFAFAVVGGAAAFLWFNAYPAQVFMGEVGSQSLAVGLVVLAFMTGWWLLLPVIGVVFFLEGLSDVVQIGYFKATGGRRLLRMAPIHYHFQLGGWAETQVVTRLWLLGLFGGLAGTALAVLD